VISRRNARTIRGAILDARKFVRLVNRGYILQSRDLTGLYGRAYLRTIHACKAPEVAGPRPNGPLGLVQDDL
jgi:hypothetical protein